MKIAKYIILLLALLGVAFVVFIATQPNHFSVSSSLSINHSKDSVASFISDASKWQLWFNAFESDSKNVLSVEDYTINWVNENRNGKFQLIKKHKNDSISQKFDYEGIKGESNWNFKPEENNKKTNISWTLSGDLNFQWKIKALLSGGIEKFLQKKQQYALQEINKQIAKTIQFHEIIITGIVTKHETNYVFQKDSVASTLFDTTYLKNIRTVSLFIKQNNIATNGNPFVLVYQNQKAVEFASCIPITEEIITTSDSKINASKLNEFQALKVVFKGNLSFKKDVFIQAKNYLEKNKYVFDERGFKWLEIHKEEIDTKGTISESIEFYFPVKKKFIPVTPKDSTETTTPTSDSIR
jgi:carbon monoxide dehydrogenase subunit G